MSEADVTKQVIDYLQKLIKEGHPLYYEHRSGQSGFGYKKGIPDLFIVYKGQHAEIELKDLHGHRSSMQDKFKWKCETIYYIPYCCPHSFEEFKQWFDSLFL